MRLLTGTMRFFATGVFSAMLLCAQHGSGGHGGGFSGAGLGGGAGRGASAPLNIPGVPRLASVPGSLPSYGANAYPGVSLSAYARSGSAYPNRGRNGGNRYGYGRSSYRGLSVGVFLTPYYYPGLDYGSSPYNDIYADYGYSGPDPYQGGPGPGDDPLMGQVAQLNAQVQELRNSLQQSQAPPPPPETPAGQDSAANSAPPVTLVLRGGQTLQVQNYAVMDNVFWDFSRQPARPIPVSNIDVAASAKATEASGAEFPLHPAGQ